MLILGSQSEQKVVYLSEEYLSCWNQIKSGLQIEDIVSSLTPTERDSYLALCSWNGQIDPRLYEYLGLDVASITKFCKNFLMMKVGEENSRTWYEIPDYIQKYFLSKMNTDEKIKNHRLLARFLGKTIFDIRQEVSGEKKLPPFDLIRHQDGIPLGELHYEMLYTFTAGPFIPFATQQTENLELARLVAELAILWNYHLVESRQYSIALEVAFSLSDALTRWGRQEEGKSLILTTAKKWLEQEPDSAEEIDKAFSRFFGALSEKSDNSPEDQDEKDRTNDSKSLKENPDELFNEGFALRQLGRYDEALKKLSVAAECYENKEDFEALSLTLYHISDINLKIRNLARALEVNYLAEEYAKASNRELLRGQILLLRGKMLFVDNKYSQAQKQILQGLEIFSRADDKANTAQSYYTLATINYSQRNLSEAEEQILKALDYANYDSDPFETARMKLLLGTLYEETERLDLALEALTNAHDLFLEASDNREHVKSCQEMIDNIRVRQQTLNKK